MEHLQSFSAKVKKYVLGSDLIFKEKKKKTNDPNPNWDLYKNTQPFSSSTFMT